MTWWHMNSAGANGIGVTMFAMHFAALASLPSLPSCSAFARRCKSLLEAFQFYAHGLPQDTPLDVVRDLLVDQCCSFWWQANMVAPGHGMQPKQALIKEQFQEVFGIKSLSTASGPAPAPASARNGSMLQGLSTQDGDQIGSTPSV